MVQQRDKAAINALTNKIQELQAENDKLKAEIRRLGGNSGAGPAIQQRTCIHCRRTMPDGPAYFPGFFEEPSTDLTAERWRHSCIYCRGQGQ
jgi:hypothetical protein